MIKRNILTVAVLLVIVGSAIAVYSSRSAHAQASAGRRWEYCAVTHIGVKQRTTGDPQAEPYAVITYFGTAGDRTEEVVGGDSGSVDPALSSLPKAIAKLGADGWEIVGDQGVTLGFRREQGGGLLGLLFKRPR